MQVSLASLVSCQLYLIYQNSWEIAESSECESLRYHCSRVSASSSAAVTSLGGVRYPAKRNPLRPLVPNRKLCLKDALARSTKIQRENVGLNSSISFGNSAYSLFCSEFFMVLYFLG